jgi:hypothetical protein
LAATAQATEVSELNRKLQVANEEIDRINKRFDEMQGMRIMLKVYFDIRSNMYI